MELFFPLLGVLLVVLTGWLLGIYLFVPWGRNLKRREVSTPWSVIWVFGWLLQPVGWGLQTLGLLSAWGDVGTGLIYLSPILWIVAFFMFRRKRIASEPPTPAHDYLQEGIWPPPPQC